MAKHVVTLIELEARTVTIDVPHGELLARAGLALGRWQEQVDQLAEGMTRLEQDGVFLDNSDPVVPGWWERIENGHHKAWYLVWPAEYARRTGRKRREYVKRGDLEATRATVERSLEYANLKTGFDRLTRQIDAAGQELVKLAEKYEW